MKVLTIGKGLIGEDGKPVTGQTVSAATPEKIVYTGGVSAETLKVEKWAKKIGAEFSTSGSVSTVKKEVKKEVKKDTIELPVDELYPEEEDVPSVEEVKSSFLTY